MATNSSLVLVALMVTLSCIASTSAKVYTVGDSAGWALSVDYVTWASDKTFKVGDKLVFNYDSSHTVDVVSSSDYTTCAIGNSIASYNSGTTTIPLNTTGSHYFICGIMGHCDGGMKLSIDVTSNIGSPLGAPLAAPSPITADSPITTPSGGTTLPNPNAVTGTNNIPVDSSTSRPAFSTFATVVFSSLVVAFMSQLVVG